jgi:adenosylmethionine-8-amino-7-oxononanoate aminotransferase
VEVALKMALQYWHQNGQPGRRRFLSLPGAYHGDTLGAMSVSDIAEFKDPFDAALFPSLRPPAATTAQRWWQATDAIESLLDEQGDQVAAVVVEPMVQGAAGMRMWPASELRRLREWTQRAGTLLIADEVFTGLGRTGEMWGCDHAQVTPDILCTAKGLSGGALPFAATLATERVYEGFAGGPERAFMHGHTFYGNPLGATVAREVLAVYRDEQVVAQVRAKEPILRRRFNELGGLEGVGTPRSLGMVAAVDLGKPGYHEPLGKRVAAAARRRGVYLRPLGNTVFVVPPLTISEDDLLTLLDRVCASVEEVVRSRG